MPLERLDKLHFPLQYYTSTGHKLRFYNQLIHCNSLSYPEFDTQFMPAQHINFDFPPPNGSNVPNRMCFVELQIQQ